MIEQTLDIETKDGGMETFVTYPERGGPFPAVFLLMDAPGIREELRDMARRLATRRLLCADAQPELQSKRFAADRERTIKRRSERPAFGVPSRNI